MLANNSTLSSVKARPMRAKLLLLYPIDELDCWRPNGLCCTRIQANIAWHSSMLAPCRRAISDGILKQGVLNIMMHVLDS